MVEGQFDRSAFVRARNLAIAEDWSNGASDTDLVSKYALSITSIAQIARAHGARRPKSARKQQVARTPERDATLASDYLSGQTLEQVGQKHGITRERVRQILARDGIIDRHNGFSKPERVAVRARKLTADERAEQRRRAKAEREAITRELYDSGKTYEEICAQTGSCITLVQKDIWKTGGPNRNAAAGKPKRKLTDAQRHEIGLAYSLGAESLGVIARRYNIVPEYVSALACRLGYKRRAAAA